MESDAVDGSSRASDDNATNRDDTERSSMIATDLAAVIQAMGGTQRDGQLQMAQEVIDAFASEHHALIQAGTGTGKSLAYLVPAVRHATDNDARVVVSTATLALQRQILTHDLPLVTSALRDRLGREPEVGLVKGWHHYVCRHKVAGGFPAEAQDGLFPAADGADAPISGLGEQVVRARAWAEETDTGDRDDLVPGVSDKAWSQVSVTARECLSQQCPMLSECWAQQAREHARQSDIVVTNHAVLGLLAAGTDHVLPEFDALIIDEAHELVDKVTNAATIEFTSSGIEHAARSARRHLGLPTPELDTAASSFNVALASVPDGVISGDLPAAVHTGLESIRDASRELLSRAGKPSADNLGGHKSATAALQEVFDTAERMLDRSSADVLWCSRGFRETLPRLVLAPLDVRSTIRHGLLERASTVATSATLTVAEDFTATAQAYGLPTGADQEGAWRGLDVGSPFDYGKQGILYVASDLPAPGREPVTDQQLDRILQLIVASDGGALGLFSSRRAAEAAAEGIRERTDIPVLCQGDDQLPTLVREFAADPRTCLFGTLSLWQGIDVPGASNRMVIIDRIPFPRPDDPLQSARARAVERAGGNGFRSISLHHAAIRLAQGVGRLIRTSEDRGVVAILDPRVVTKSYGGLLLKSLPPMWKTQDVSIVTGALERLHK